MQRGADSFLTENSAYVYNISVVDEKISSLDHLYVQEEILVIPSLIDGSHCIKNVINFEGESWSSQYENEEAKSYVSSDDGEVSNLIYYEEASYEDNDESCYSTQEEDNGSRCSSSHESDANWEEESNDRVNTLLKEKL